MVHIARLTSTEGDYIEISFERTVTSDYNTFRGTGIPLYTSYYGKNISIFLKLAPHRENPLKVYSGMYSICYGRDSNPQCNFELWFQGESGVRCYHTNTNTDIHLQTQRVQGSDETARQEFTFTLVYDGCEVPLIDPMNGSPKFITELYYA